MRATLNWDAVKKAIPAIVLTTTISAGFVLANGNSESPGIPKNTENDKNRFIQVQLLGLNDLHGQLDRTRKFNGRYMGKVEYLAAYLKQRKGETKNTLLVHAGDMVGGSAPVSSLLQEEPTIKVLNKIGFNLGTLGNHEFDRGVKEMMRLIHGGTNPKAGYFEGAQFPYVCANVMDEKTGKLILPPYEIKTFNGIPIGFIGVVLSDTPKIANASVLVGVKFTDEVKAINKAVAELKKQGVKAIVVLAHNGGSQSALTGAATGDIIDIAKKVDDEVDVMFGGHTHTYLNAEVDGKLLVEAYSYGTAFSDVDLKLDPATKEIVTKKAEIVYVYQDAIKPDEEIKKMVKRYEAKVAPIVSKVVGTAANDITGTRNKSGESALGNLIADSQRTAMNSDFAFMNPAGIRADIQAGEVNWGELFTILPFTNNLVKVTLTGDQIRRVLNQQWQPKGIVRMLQISGLKYTWSGTKGTKRKVLDIFRADGTPINPDSKYTVTVTSYLANGGDDFTVFLEGTDKVDGPVDIDVFENYVKQRKQPFASLIEGRVTKIK
ncbi:5'-nucleotidase C-terminal domain-containing protein [Bacillus sp. ISL-40]|uniref:bifunctional metallophosphatase/5'-nucleotidase n=1 Tax=unclassified Bacillus (in: firmicutes) TaxID=185979 RepID=UPI001BE64A4C|nr:MULTISPECIES: 5'-nucleotidase C-terminal domain-containing protein [unclassified Bacillus (in: firmicutes)]MBT2695884.1 5'-nucleotidase C-terminal domain-containing protein [Bacillus sp. ISL-40]MBT2739760.1 5'-nucleotidase C-terminal domain-containing protein [Bacillus sp. ISL-77]